MINLYSPTNTLSYSIHGLNMLKGLIENGNEVFLSPIGELQADSFFKCYIDSALANKSKYSSKDPSLFIFHDEYSMNASSKSCLLTFSVFETTKPKDISVKILENGPTDVVLTTTKEHADILKTLISKPVEVVNEGIDPTIYNTIPVDPYIKTDKFTYILVGKREERKNTDLTLRVFINTMKENKVALIAHTFNPFLNQTKDHPFQNLNCWCGVNPIKQGFEYKGFNGKAHKFSYKECDIYFSTPTIPVSMMSSLYHSANVGIACSRSEGWGLPEVEMMACGLPVIATDCMGHNEYIHQTPEIQTNLIIKKETMSIANDGIWFQGNGEWDDLNITMFISKLEETYSNPSLYTIKDEELADFMANNYNWNKAALKLTEVMTRYKG